ncbi:MAG: peptidoglycan DD-metalloendopeptidase family protein [bacterium]|nr:peptidoglycan DD-metalloendopeptidase family protein [bacterium]MDZ4285075.1 peptidoglycan DD-metalloendopeptidase family protein [Patescibacteria group bacterium]
MFAVRACVGLTLAAVATAEHTSAQSSAEIKSKIDAHTGAVASLEHEIKRYEAELAAVGRDADTLEGAVARLTISIKKFNADIALTEREISETSARIATLSGNISDKERRIAQNTAAIAETLRRVREQEAATLIEVVLSESRLSGFWDSVASIRQFQETIRTELASLRAVKTELEGLREKEEDEQLELIGLRIQLADQKSLVEAERREQRELLRLTKNKESNYQELLATKLAEKEAFEREIHALEAALEIAIDPLKLPEKRPGVLAWPLESITVTQYFGNTDFARANAGIYQGKGHNGIDFRASVGTSVKSALVGIVEAAGDTDLVRGCSSYGKWVLVRHANGLSTLYAHLSLVKVTEGSKVATGDIIGYSGKTGYSTGPHLHFTVYATQGVRVQRFANSVNCKNASIPIADLKAYLNPLDYLPAMP